MRLRSDALHPTRRITQSLHTRGAHAVAEAEEEVAHRDAAVLYESAGRERAAAGAGEEHREIHMAVAVAVGVAAAVDDHRVVQE